AVLGVASWTAGLGPLELEPHVALGFERTIFSGAEPTMPRSEEEVLPLARAGLWVRYRYDMWTFGGAVELGRAFGTPTYTRTDNPNARIFELPAMGVSLGLIVAADLGR